MIPHPPRFDGRFGVVVQAGLTVVGGGACASAPYRVCSVDGDETYLPVRKPGYATLEHARTPLAGGHTSWTAVLEFADPSRPAVMYAGRVARSVGGVVLVMTREHEVLVTAPPTQVHQGVLRLTDLDERTAWGLVGLFVGG
jgi:hypothetical protein